MRQTARLNIAKIHDVSLDGKDGIERVLTILALGIIGVGAFYPLFITFLWFSEFLVFHPLLSEYWILNLVNIFMFSLAMFDLTTWFAGNIAMLLIYTNGISRWLKHFQYVFFKQPCL